MALSNQLTFTPNLWATKPATTPGQLSESEYLSYKPILGDIVNYNAPKNKYLKSGTYSGDPTAIKERLSQYSVYDPVNYGTLADYLRPKAAAVVNNQMLFKPEEFKNITGNLTAIGKDQQASISPMLGGLSSLGSLNNAAYYSKPELEAQLGKYATTDISKYSAFPEFAGLKPVSTIDNKPYYLKSDLESAQGGLGKYVTADISKYASLPEFAGLKPIATLDNSPYYLKSDLESAQQGLGKYATADLSPYKNLSPISGLSPVANIEGTPYYLKSDLDKATTALNDSTFSAEAFLDPAARSAKINELYQDYLGRGAEAAGLDYWGNQIASGKLTWNNLVKAISGSDEGKAYLNRLNEPIAANRPLYYTQQYDYNDWGYNPRTNADGSPVYGFSNPGAEQIPDYANSVYRNLLGRDLTADERAAFDRDKYYYGKVESELPGALSNAVLIEQAILKSPEFQNRKARTNVWVTDTKTGQPLLLSGTVANLPGAAQLITTGRSELTPQSQLFADAYPEAKVEGWNSDGGYYTDYDRNKLAQAIENDPVRYMNAMFSTAAGGMQREMMIAQAGFANSGVTQETLQKLNNDAQTYAKWLLDNGVSKEQLQSTFDAAQESARQSTAQSIADQKSSGGGGFFGGDWLGDFLEKYQLPIMASILGGAVLGPAIGGAVGAVPGSATAAAINAGVTGLGTAGLNLAQGAPLDKALLSGGLSALSAGALSGLNFADSLVNAGMNPTMAQVVSNALGSSVVNAGGSALMGQNLQDILKSGAIGGLGAAGGTLIGKGLGNLFSDTGAQVATNQLSPLQLIGSKLSTGLAQGGLNALLRGSDFGQGITAGGLSGLISGVVPKFPGVGIASNVLQQNLLKQLYKKG